MRNNRVLISNPPGVSKALNRRKMQVNGNKGRKTGSGRNILTAMIGRNKKESSKSSILVFVASID
jgi:hypothetical protein